MTSTRHHQSFRVLFILLSLIGAANFSMVNSLESDEALDASFKSPMDIHKSIFGQEVRDQLTFLFAPPSDSMTLYFVVISWLHCIFVIMIITVTDQLMLSSTSHKRAALTLLTARGGSGYTVSPLPTLVQ